MRCKSLLCNFIHSRRTNLNLNPFTSWRHYRCVQRFISVSSRRRNPIAQTIRTRLIEIGYDTVDSPTIRLLEFRRRFNNNSNGENVVYLFKRNTFRFNFSSNRRNRFGSNFDFINVAFLRKCFTDRVYKFSNETISYIFRRF